MSALRRSPLKKQSKKRAKANKLYLAKRKAFLALRPLCEVWLSLRSSDDHDDAMLQLHIFGAEHLLSPAYSQDVHHMRKPRATYLNDESTWMAVSRKAHDWIEGHKKEARARGWLK